MTQTVSDSYFSGLATLEARYDGPIPTYDLRALRHGSALAADIAETEAEVAFFRAMILSSRASSRAWLRRGNRSMTAAVQADAWRYLRAWRRARHKLAELLHESKAREACVDAAQQRLLAIVGAKIIAPLIRGIEESTR